MSVSSWEFGSKLRRWLARFNFTLAAAFGGALAVLMLAPQVVERQVGARLEAVLTERALERLPGLSAGPDLGTLARAAAASALGQRLAGTALGRYAELRYAEHLRQLTEDLRIFAATNLLLFVLAAVAVRRARAPRSALVLSLILTASALVGGCCYVFGQDWLETVLFSSYFGYGYCVLVGLLAALLCDIALNQARVLRSLPEALAWGAQHHHS